MSSQNPDEPGAPATDGVETPAAASLIYPAYEIARLLVPVCDELSSAMADLSARYADDLHNVRGATLGLTALAALLDDDAPLLEAYAILQEISHITHTIGERSARINWPDAIPSEPRAAAQLTNELVSLLLLAMDRDDRMARLRLSPSGFRCQPE